MSLAEHSEDPLAAAAAKAAGYVSVAAVVAEAAVQLAAARDRDRAVADERRAAALRAGHRADHARAQLDWAPVLDPTRRGQTDVRAAGLAWAQAQRWRPDPEAERVTGLAEDRLRTLRPDVMERYDRLRAEGVEPVAAMGRVAPGFDAPPARTGQPAPVRTGLTARDPSRRAGDAELVRYRAAGPVVLATASYPVRGDTAAASTAATALAAHHPPLQRTAAQAAVAGRSR